MAGKQRGDYTQRVSMVENNIFWLPGANGHPWRRCLATNESAVFKVNLKIANEKPKKTGTMYFATK